MKSKNSSRKKINKKASKGFRGYPIATMACYGPDDKRASKIVVGIVTREYADPDVLKKWYSDKDDVRLDFKIQHEILDFIDQQKVKSVVFADGIMGCPHEEGIDYPIGKKCPKCPFWSRQDSFSDETIH